jgi:hypothetical protein
MIKEKSTYTDEQLLGYLIKCIHRLNNPKEYEGEKEFLEIKAKYLSYKKIWHEELLHPDPELFGPFILKEEDFEKLQWKYKLNQELPKYSYSDSFENKKEGKIDYDRLKSWNRRSKKEIVRLALFAEGINPELMFPPSILKRIVRYIGKL